jgi:hypothetical protein
MKTGLTLIACMLSAAVITGCGGNSAKGSSETGMNPADTGKAVLSFIEYEHDFGKVNEGERIGCFFSFTNSGTSDLLISSAVTSCGCTVPKFEKKPVRPGDSGTLEVIFDTSGRNGIQTKTIAVHSNAARPVVVLQIKAEVINNNN